jgi:hypothetical protein
VSSAAVLACGPVVICDPISGLAGGAVSGVAGSTAKDAASSVFSALASWLATGADQLLAHVLDLVTGSTQLVSGGAPTSAASAAVRPDLTSPWFVHQETLMVELMALVMFPLLGVSTIGAILHQDLHRLTRTWLVALPVAILCGFVGIELTTVGLEVTDALTATVLSSVDLTKTIGVAVEGMSDPVTGPVVTGIIAFLALVAAVMLWLELVLRSAAIYIAVLFLPLALAGLVWPSTTRMAKRLVEMLLALLLSKFVVAAVLALGANAVGAGGADGAITGVAILLIAAFAPFMLFRMVPIIEAAAIGHLEGASHRPFRAAQRGAQTAAGLPGGPIGAALGFGGSHSDGAPFSPARVVDQPIGHELGEYPGGSGDGAGPAPAPPDPGHSGSANPGPPNPGSPNPGSPNPGSPGTGSGDRPSAEPAASFEPVPPGAGRPPSMDAGMAGSARWARQPEPGAPPAPGVSPAAGVGAGITAGDGPGASVAGRGSVRGDARP